MGRSKRRQAVLESFLPGCSSHMWDRLQVHDQQDTAPAPSQPPHHHPTSPPIRQTLLGPARGTQGQTSKDCAPPEAESPQQGGGAWMTETISGLEVTFRFPWVFALVFQVTHWRHFRRFGL